MPGYIAMKKLAVTAFMLGTLTAPAFAQSKDMEPLELMDRDKKQQGRCSRQAIQEDDGSKPQGKRKPEIGSLVEYAGSKRRQRKVTA
jgi:hypothetical protein